MMRKVITGNVINTGIFITNVRCTTFSRRPITVLKKSEPTSKIKARPNKKSAPRVITSMKTDVQDHQRPYEKLDENDDTFLKTMMLMKSKKKREKKPLILLEGRRLITDAIEARVPAECIYFSDEEQLEDIPLNELSEDVRLVKASSKQMQLWSDLTICPGIMGIFKKPNYDELKDHVTSRFPVSVVCDNVREPGNMGSILRCAAAVGCQKVYITKGCVDVWETKVLRTGCGAHFRVPIVQIDWDSIGNYFSSDVALYLADNCTGSPSHGRKEKQSATKEGRDTPTHCYTDISYGDGESVVIVGGETEGLSREAQELASKHAGVRTVIPMENNVDSLNSAMALSVILFEMMRQYRVIAREKEQSEINE